MVKRNKKLVKEIKILEEKLKYKKFDNFFLILLLFILVLEFFLISPTTSKIVEKIPMLYLSIFYLAVFMFPVWILFSYYFKIIANNKTRCATKVLALALVKGFFYFVLFIVLLIFIVLESREIAVLLLSEVYVQVAVLVGLSIVVFSFLLKLYLSSFSKSKFILECK
jgi:hypothetical protein